jgi:hypothetical protein
MLCGGVKESGETHAAVALKTSRHFAFVNTDMHTQKNNVKLNKT